MEGGEGARLLVLRGRDVGRNEWPKYLVCLLLRGDGG